MSIGTAIVPDDDTTRVDKAMHFDDLTRQETIEDRIAQEQPDPSTRITSSHRATKLPTHSPTPVRGPRQGYRSERSPRHTGDITILK